MIPNLTNNKMRHLFTIIFIPLLFSCKGKEIKTQSNLSSIGENKEIIAIDLDQIEEVQTLLVSSFFKDVSPVVLELTDESILKNISKLIPFDEYLIINDLNLNNSGIYLFNKNGKFVRRIGRIGKGPGEYSSTSDCTVNYTDGLLYVLDGNTNRILTYRLPSGEFSESVKLQDINVMSHSIEYHDGKLYVDTDFIYPGDEDYLLREIDLKTGGNVNLWLSNDKYNMGYNNRNTKRPSAIQPFYNSRSYGLKFVQFFMDMIIDIESEEIKPILSITGTQLLTRDELNSIQKENSNLPINVSLMMAPKICRIHGYVEGPGFIMFSYQKEGVIQTVVYDKNTRQAKNIYYFTDDLIYDVSQDNAEVDPSAGIGGATDIIYSDQEGAYRQISLDFLDGFRDLASEGKLNFKEEDLVKLKNLDKEANPVLMYYEY